MRTLRDIVATLVAVLRMITLNGREIQAADKKGYPNL